MADSYQINRTMQDLGSLWAAEHAEGDDQGVTQVENLVKALRKFKKHEDQEAKERNAKLAASPALREATYQLADGRSVFYDNGRETLQDAADLYAVLDEDHKTGSPNVENMQAQTILARLQTGGGLGEQEIGTLRELMTKHKPQIDKYRRSGRPGGQDLMHMASDGPDSRIINQERERVLEHYEGPDMTDDEDDDLVGAYEPEPDPISHALGATGFVDRYTLDECVERFQESRAARFPETFDRYYFQTDVGPILMDVLADGTPEQLAEEQARKHVAFKTRWCDEHKQRYLALPESEVTVDKIRRLLAGTPEPQVSKPASQRTKAPVKRGQIQRPKAAA